MDTLTKPQPKFLTGIIPNNWEETIFIYESYYLIHVSGGTITPDAWENYLKLLKNEFQENLDEVYRLPEDNTVFEVYLHKNLN